MISVTFDEPYKLTKRLKDDKIYFDDIVDPARKYLIAGVVETNRSNLQENKMFNTAIQFIVTWLKHQVIVNKSVQIRVVQLYRT